MGLEAFDIAPDNKGGRKQEDDDEEEETYGRKVEGAYHAGVDTEEWWQEQFDTFVGGEEPTLQNIADIADKTHLLPQTVKKHLTKHTVYEFEEYVEEEPTGLESIVINAK